MTEDVLECGHTAPHPNPKYIDNYAWCDIHREYVAVVTEIVLRLFAEHAAA